MNARFIAGASDPRVLPKHSQFEIAFAGRSNVGKSSLLNRLVGRRGLARVSKTPGRTQQLNFFEIGGELVFVDLPGYGFARVPMEVRARWKSLVEGYLSHRRQLRGVVLIIDIRRGIQEDDRTLIEYLASLRIPIVLVATKVDKLNRSESEKALRALALQPLPGVCALVGVSSATGDGVAELRREIERLVG